MGFQYAAKRISSASDRSAASLLRAAATTDRRVMGKDSPGALMARKSLPYPQKLLVAEGFDGIEASGFPGGVNAEADADGRTQDERGDDPEERELRGHVRSVFHEE